MQTLSGFGAQGSDTEEKPEGIRTSISRLFKLSKGTSLPVSQNLATSTDVKKEDESFCVLSMDAEPPSGSSIGSSPPQAQSEDVYERTPKRVQNMIRTLLAVKANKDDRMTEAELRKHWLPDEMALQCYECSKKFSTFLRRHHCRICGLIFCSKCCNSEIRGKIMGFIEDLRVCDYCYKFAMKYLQNIATAETRSLQEDFHSFDDSQSEIGSIGRSRRTSMCIFDENLRSSPSTPLPAINAIYETMEPIHPLSGATPVKEARLHQPTAEERRNLVQDSVQLRQLRNIIVDSVSGVELKVHRNRLRTYHNCCTGKDIVDWLISTDRAITRIQATAIAQALLEAGFLECLTNQEFTDSLALYRPIASRSQKNKLKSEVMAAETAGKDEPQWVRQILEGSASRASIETTFGVASSAISLTDVHLPAEAMPTVQTGLEIPLNLELPIAAGTPFAGEIKHLQDEGLWLPADTPGAIEPDPDAWLGETSAQAEGDLREAKKKLNDIYKNHELKLLQQLISLEGLNSSWIEVIQKLTHLVVSMVRFNTRFDEDIDVRSRIKIKKLTGGRREESRVMNGLAISKTVAHKNMHSSLKNPRIVLISGGIDYLERCDKMITFESLAKEETDYYRKTISNVESWQPNIVVCSGPVSRIAQDSLRQRGITLVAKVKSDILQRLAKICQGEIVYHIDAQTLPPECGHCTSFFVQNFTLDNGKSKCLMFFEQRDDHESVFSSVILRGGTDIELSRVKRVMLFMALVAYNWRCERSFLCNEMAIILDYSAGSESESESEEAFETNCGYFDIVGTKLSSAHEAVEDFRLAESTDSDAVFLESERRRKKGKHRLLKSQITDQSDPLHSPKVRDESSDETVSVVDISTSTRVRLQSILEDIPLSSSPLQTFPLPYLETIKGRNSKLRNFFPGELYQSKLLGNRQALKTLETNKHIDNRKTNLYNFIVEKRPEHEFMSAIFSPDICKDKMEDLAADFRARGGNYSLKRFEQAEEKNCEEETTHELIKDPLDPRSHQKLQVLFSSHSVASLNRPHPCVAPWPMTIEFYGKSDLTLGNFLERLCFNVQDLPCPSDTCKASMISHIRRFVHGDACIHVILRKLENPLPARDGAILLWTYCKKCKSLSPVTALSDDAWNLSFAKYLEIRFYGHVYRRRGSECPHRLHVDHYQYFGMDDMVVSMKYTSIGLREISLPSVNIHSFPFTFLLKYTMDEIKNVTLAGSMVYSSVKEGLQTLGYEFSGTKHESAVSGLLLQIEAERSLFRDRVEEVQIMLSSSTLTRSGSLASQEELLYEILDRETYIKKLLADTANIWTTRLQDLIQIRKKEEKSRTGSRLQSMAVPANSEVRNEPNEAGERSPAESEHSETGHRSNGYAASGSPSRTRRQLRKTSSGSSTVKGTFDGRSRSDSASPVRQSVSEDSRKEMNRVSVDLSKMAPSRDSSPDGFKSNMEKKNSLSGTTTPSSVSHSSTVKNLISGLLSSSQSIPLQLPFLATEHHLLAPSGRFPLSVYELEPSSIIAFALASSDYEQRLSQQNNFSSPRIDVAMSKSDGDRSKVHKDNRKANETKKDDAEPQVYDQSDESDASNSAAHIEIQFPDTTTDFYCKIYFSAAFKQLRSYVMPDGEMGFIRSLSRCAPWAAAGGKSGLTFCKTLDDRFVIKQMNRHEVESLMDIAPSYVSYMTKSIADNKPTALCKVLGAYRTVYKNNVTGLTSKQDLLVMENLFYKREISATYDLKGSVRNRMVPTAGRSAAELVMLDENLIQVTVDNPFYIRAHSSSVLKVALSRDTQFLASHLIMDYSLLVGVDDKNDEFVIGIIDYMRTFTWDKKLETFVKSSGLLGGQGKQPTIVSPDIYRSRFCDAMSRYFLAVPDRWTGLSSNADC
ncbi:1-phosphatidylinositol 3-phosphate 5-kinase-like [Artemia franciscana]|uniref:1-phosphatidylinositol 3-phosphate 5-kinase-like n=1 Tax=Artemia franciscana TaxID=6661 RepID=UPI0032D9C564